jgi:hypothetical protein
MSMAVPLHWSLHQAARRQIIRADFDEMPRQPRNSVTMCVKTGQLPEVNFNHHAFAKVYNVTILAST